MWAGLAILEFSIMHGDTKTAATLGIMQKLWEGIAKSETHLSPDHQQLHSPLEWVWEC